jgi:hypothetical protein
VFINLWVADWQRPFNHCDDNKYYFP